MIRLPRRPLPFYRHTLTGLGVVLAALAHNAHAGWDCSQGAGGEWVCQGNGETINSAPEVAVPASVSTTVSAATATNAPADTSTPSAATSHTENAQAETADERLSPRHIVQLSDDWVPLSKLTAQQRNNLNEKNLRASTLCCGAYVDPTDADNHEEPSSAQVSAHADNTETDMAKQTTALKGNVQISQGYRYLRADSATLQKNPQKVTLEGNVTLREPNLLLLSDKADVLVDDSTAELSNVQYLMHEQHIHGTAQSLSRSETGVASMIDARYSYCPVGSEQWTLQSSSLTLDPNDSQGRARNVTLRIKDVPVFYTPYLQFPLGDKRMSGFLVPSFGSGEDGLDIAAPYYVNLAPDYDLLLTPRYISDRGAMLGSKFRHMSALTRTNLNVDALPGDEKADDGNSDRWYLNTTHNGSAKRWESLVNFTTVSDDEYFHDFSNSGLRSANATNLRKEAGFDYLPDNWRVGVKAKDFQTLGDTLVKPHTVLPSLFADGIYALESGPVITLHNAMTRFDHSDSGDIQNKLFYDIDYNPLTQSLGRENQIITGNRYNLDYSIALPLRSAGAFFTPKIGVRNVTQALDDTTVNTPDSNPSATVGVASIDSGLIFERDSQWFGKHYRQTLEPRAFYYYAGKQDQDDIYNFESDSLSFSYAQLFRDYRLAGEDYVEDANQISTGVSSRLLDPQSGREILRVGIGQSYYLSNRDIVLESDPATARYEQERDSSSIVGEIAARLNRDWDIRTETLWNDDRAQRERQSVALRYRDDERRLFNIGYQFLDRKPSPNADLVMTDRTVEQNYVSAVYPLNNQWSLIGHWNHDVTNDRDLERIAGFEYDSCCWSVRLVARSWAVNRNFVDNVDEQQTDNGVFLQVQLKSLGNFGDSLDDRLSDSILGYEDRNKPLD